MYPEHIREMMASIQFSTSPLRQKQCRRPYCKKAFTDETNRGDVCSYHPGIRVFRVRPCVEGEEPTEGFDGVNEELWTCCGQPYVDFSKGKNGRLGRDAVYNLPTLGLMTREEILFREELF